jgi:hypothetical protein
MDGEVAFGKRLKWRKKRAAHEYAAHKRYKKRPAACRA